jgi:hypothetical protein
MQTNIVVELKLPATAMACGRFVQPHPDGPLLLTTVA